VTHRRLASLVRAAALAAAALLAACATAPDAAVAPPGRWEKLATEPYRGKQDDIAFASASVGWYGNGSGKVFRTSDGGTSWTLQWSRPGTFVRALAAVDERTVVVGNIGPGYFPNVSDKNPIYRSTDGGATWEPVTAIDGPVPVGICAFDVFRRPFINAGRLDHRTVIHAGGRVGGPAVLLRSDDGGASWTSRSLEPLAAMVLDVKFVTDRIGFVAGATDADIQKSRPVILRTDDGGSTWRRVHVGSRAFETTWKIAFPTERVGYVTVQSYDPDPANVRRYVAKTVDGGRTWRELPVTQDRAWRPFGIGFADARRGWIGGSTGGYETTDGGRTWRPVGMGRAVNKIRVVADGPRATAYAIGSDVHRLRLR